MTDQSSVPPNPWLGAWGAMNHSKTGWLPVLRTQVRTIRSLVAVEGANRFAHKSIGIFEELAGILLHVFFFAAVRVMAGAPTHYGMSGVPFLATGIFTYWIFRTTLVNSYNYNAGKPRYPVLPTVTGLDVLISRSLVSGSVFIGMSAGVFFALYLFGLSPFPAHPWMVLFWLCVSWVWGFAFGLNFAALFIVLPAARTLLGGSLRFMMYTSGVFFVWSEIPYKYRWFAKGNPFFHLVESLRSSYFPSYHSPIADMSYVLKVVAVTLVSGLFFERISRKGFETRGGKRFHEEDDLFGPEAM